MMVVGCWLLVVGCSILDDRYSNHHITLHTISPPSLSYITHFAHNASLDATGKGAAILTAAVRDKSPSPSSSSLSLPSQHASQNPSQNAPVNSLTASQKLAANVAWEPTFSSSSPTTTTALPAASRAPLPQHVVQAMALSGTPRPLSGFF